MSKTIKQNLFRFVTLRNPQLIDEKENHPGLVFHPNVDLTGSIYASAIQESDNEVKQSLLDSASSAFSALKTRKDVKESCSDLYNFSLWLMRNKNHLDYVSIKDKLVGVAPLNASESNLIWDNLLYQTVNKKSTYVREALINILIANQFLKAFKAFAEGLTEDIIFTEDQEKGFVQRANACVVIPKKLLLKGDILKANNRRIFTEAEERAIDNKMEESLAQEKVSGYNTLLKELEDAEKIYNQKNKEAYELALKAQKEELDLIIGKTTPVIIDITDPVTRAIEQVKTYPDLVPPKLNFKKIDGLSLSFLESEISDASKLYFQDLNLDRFTEFADAYKAIKEELTAANRTIYQKSERPAKRVKIGGSSLRVPTSPALPTTPYCFSVRPGLAPLNESNVYMYLATDAHTEVVGASYQLTLNTNTSITFNGTAVRRVHGGGVSQHLGLIFFEEGIVLPAGVYTFSGQLILNNGDTISFEVTNLQMKRGTIPVAGCAEVTNGGGSPTGTIESENLYGVTNLGIADFRRVEQEVCCYVPGEVSHIENILAREYKERSTRNLISVETTTEETSEQEVEKLTDTTTTERNEMQAEVSSVINEDKAKSYGANASVSGKLLGGSFNVGGYMDSSSSSSTSNSNTQAQSYAQEMTERAMERIVKKVSRKRTSRILKEFEENNKHGFDNTKGDKHVTGIYRWVDKIYKNKLINYGKRLMYEFAIPEPSRFYKEAIYKQNDNDEQSSDVILPEEPAKPTSIGLHSAKSITETNYQNFASEYGADVPAPIDQYIKIGKSFAKDDQKYNANGYAFNEISVPDGYSASYGTVQWSVIVKQTSNKHMSIALGDARHTVIGGSGSTSFYNFSDKYKDNIPFSYGSWEVHSGHFSVTINCVRTSEAYEQWRNETYTAIMDAYQQKLDAYNDAVTVSESFDQDNTEKVTFNPLFNRSIEKKELKRIAIDLLTEPYDITVSKNDYEVGSTTTVNKTLAFQNRAAVIKFFEQAFDWDIMAYVFYPYFYGKPSDWETMFQETDAADPVFQAFLQSGMARTVVPVRPGFEDAVNWYMETGEVWNGEGLVLDQDDDLYVSVVEELQTTEGEVEDVWETKVPTALTIVQAESASLIEGGLPCFCDEHSNDNTIVSTSELLSGNDSAGVGVDLI